MIVKVQIPLFSNHEKPPVLLYNEDRSVERYIEYTDKIKATIGSEPRQFWDVAFSPITKHVIFVARVEEQGW